MALAVLFTGHNLPSASYGPLRAGGADARTEEAQGGYDDQPRQLHGNPPAVRVGSTPGEFQARYEQAVPPWPEKQVTALVDRQAPWQEMLALVTAAAPWGFLIYHKIDATPVVRLAGDQAPSVAYLMGNHTIMERMYRHEPAVLLYAPLHMVIWGDPDGSAYFTFDKPSDQVASFANPEVTAVGLELDRKMAALLDHLGVSVSDALLTN